MAAPLKGQLRIGLIGAGLIGQTHSLMLRLIADRTEGGVRIAAIYDVAHAAAEKLAVRWPDAKAAASAREILDDPAIDAVFICTPTASHREVCVAAARAGKHIFCEKPLAMSAPEAAEMQAEIERAGVISQVGLVMRFAAVYTVMRELASQYPRYDYRRIQVPSAHRAVERGVSKGEDTAVGACQPVPVSVGSGCHRDDRSAQVQPDRVGVRGCKRDTLAGQRADTDKGGCDREREN